VNWMGGEPGGPPVPSGVFPHVTACSSFESSVTDGGRETAVRPLSLGARRVCVVALFRSLSWAEGESPAGNCVPDDMRPLSGGNGYNVPPVGMTERESALLGKFVCNP